MTLPPPYEKDCHAVASELREAMTKTEAVSDERLREMLAGLEGVTPGPWVAGSWTGRCLKPEHAGRHPGKTGDNPCVYTPELCEGDDGIASISGGTVVGSSYDGAVIGSENVAHIARCDPDTIRYLVTQELSRRAANSAGGVDEAIYLRSYLSWAVAQIEAMNDGKELSVSDWAEDAAMFWQAKQIAAGNAIEHLLHDEDTQSSPAVEAEPVAWRPTYEAISAMVHACRERQKAAGEGDQMLSRWISEGLDGLFTHPSSSVSAEVTEEMVETVAMTMHDHRKATDSLWTLWEDMPEDYRQTSLAMVRAGLAALNGGRENG